MNISSISILLIRVLGIGLATLGFCQITSDALRDAEMGSVHIKYYGSESHVSTAGSNGIRESLGVIEQRLSPAAYAYGFLETGCGVVLLLGSRRLGAMLARGVGAAA